MKKIVLNHAAKASRAEEIRFLALGNKPDIDEQIATLLNAHGFSGETCTKARDAMNLMQHSVFHVLIYDSILPDVGPLEFLQELRLTFPDVASVLITDCERASERIRVAQVCGSEYLLKPVAPDTLVASVNRAVAIRRLERDFDLHRENLEALVERHAQQIEQAVVKVERTFEETLRLLGHVLELRDNETAGHCERVARYSLELARTLGCTLDEIEIIVRGAYLHDIGKIGIDDSILRKAGPLTPGERVIMETHATIGYDMLRRISFLASPAQIILTHHERFDGTGYPHGLSGHDIPLGSRIFAVADTLDAITSHRPYRCARPYSAARDQISMESGRQFDPKIVNAFLLIPTPVFENIRNQVGPGTGGFSFGLRRYTSDPAAQSDSKFRERLRCKNWL